MDTRIPNAVRPTVVESKTEEQLLIAEMAYSPAFRRFLEYIVAPRIRELRQKLLRDPNLSEGDRRGCVLHLLGVESLVGKVFEETEAGVPPAWVQAIFH